MTIYLILNNPEALTRSPHDQKCCSCEAVLQETITGKHKLGDGSIVCSDCYYEALGLEIEERPITSGGIVR
jgi:hypothetical protein